jgi:hypothetical protein
MASDTQTKVGGRSTLQDRCGRHTAHRSPKFSCAGRKGLHGIGICPRCPQQPIPFSLTGRALPVRYASTLTDGRQKSRSGFCSWSFRHRWPR